MRSATPFHLRATIVLACCACALMQAAAAGAQPRMLSDSTTVAFWTLPNGMHVVTRDIPRASGIAVTLAYGLGSDQDPRGREGLHQVMAYAAFLAAAGDFPERSLDKLDSVRPQGWSVETGPSYTRLTDVTARDRLAGVLHEWAQRVRSAVPSAKALAEAKQKVLAANTATYTTRPGLAIHRDVHLFGVTSAADRIDRYASGKAVTALALKDVQQAIHAEYVPANAVLSLAGNLKGSGLDLQRFIANEFATIPGGTRIAPALPATPHSIVKRLNVNGMARPMAVVGLIAPALDDTTHPSFFMNSLVIGSLLTRRWGRSPDVPSPFRYSLFEDPTLVRIYAPLTPSDVDSSVVREEYSMALMEAISASIKPEEFGDLHDGVVWLLGGPLNADLRSRVASDAGVLVTLSTTAATRELWGGESFWSAYRDRFDRQNRPAFGSWARYFVEPSHQVQILAVPADLTNGK